MKTTAKTLFLTALTMGTVVFAVNTSQAATASNISVSSAVTSIRSLDSEDQEFWDKFRDSVMKDKPDHVPAEPPKVVERKPVEPPRVVERKPIERSSVVSTGDYFYARAAHGMNTPTLGSSTRTGSKVGSSSGSKSTTKRTGGVEHYPSPPYAPVQPPYQPSAPPYQPGHRT